VNVDLRLNVIFSVFSIDSEGQVMLMEHSGTRLDTSLVSLGSVKTRLRVFVLLVPFFPPLPIYSMSH